MPSFKLNYRAFLSSAFIYKFTIAMVDGLLNMSKVSGIVRVFTLKQTCILGFSPVLAIYDVSEVGYI